MTPKSDLAVMQRNALAAWYGALTPPPSKIKIGDVPSGIVALDAWTRFRLGVPFYANLICRGADDRQVLPLSHGAIVWPGQAVGIVTRVMQMAVWPDRLLISRPDGWLVDELRVGNRCVLGPGAGADAREFLMLSLDCGAVQVGMDVRLIVRNVEAGGDDALAYGLRLDGKLRWFQRTHGRITAHVNPMLAPGVEGYEPEHWPGETLTAVKPTVLAFYSEGDDTPNPRVYAVDDATGLLVLDYRYGAPVRFDLGGLSEP